MIDIQRIISHAMTTRGQVRRAFPAAASTAIEQAIQGAEAGHAGEIRFVVEAALDGLPLLKSQTARERALEVFSQLGVWDTEHNSGVLIYLLLADRRVEIVADRGIHARVGAAAWAGLCRAMEISFREGHYEHGAVACIGAVAAQLKQHFPAGEHHDNELPDAPVFL